MRKSIIFLALFSFLISSVASAAMDCCAEMKNTPAPEILMDGMDEPCHETSASPDENSNSAMEDHCQCESCPQAENTLTEIIPDTTPAGLVLPLGLARFSSLDPDRIDHPPKHIS